MSNRTLAIDDRIYDYMISKTSREPELMAALREETAKLPLSRMQIAPEQGQLMGLLVELLGAERAIEVGVFTGYSALAVARALPEHGKLVACDVSEEWTRMALRYFEMLGVAHKIDLRLGPGVDTLKALLAAGEAESYDFCFVDADKESYDAYYELCLELLRPGGLVAIDNALWGGDVADPSKDDADTRSIRALNEKVGRDARVTQCLVPIGDGLLLARKRR